MKSPFIIVKSYKSVGVAIMLTLLFGPLGLFYASVTGGLIMTFSPLILFALLVIGFFKESSFLLSWSLVLLVFFGLTFWLINIIWAVVSVKSYNKEIDYDSKRQHDLWNGTLDKDKSQPFINVISKVHEKNTLRTIEHGSSEVASKPNIQEWLKANPSKSINDYYSKYHK